MFGTLRIGSDKNSTEFVEHAKGEAARRLRGYVFSHAACEHCRLKKLRCNKHKSGCDRCKRVNLKCSYQNVAKSNSPRSKSRSNSQASSSNTSGAASTGDSLMPLDNNVVDQEIGWWEMAEADPTSSVATTTSQSLRDPSHVEESEYPNVDDQQIHFSESELTNAFSNIADVQSDGMQTNAFMGAGKALLDAEVFESISETANYMLDDMGDLVTSQPASVTAQPSFMAFDHARTSPSSTSRQNHDALARDDLDAMSLGRAKPRTDPQSCECRTIILHVLAEIESRILSARPRNMYAMLAYQRQTTAESNAILKSRLCKCRIELFGLLVIIAEKITSLSEAIITAFVCRIKEQSDSIESDEAISPIEFLGNRSTIRLHEFQVQTPEEFTVISAAVIKLQLKSQISFISRTRELAISMNSVGQAQSLKRLESRLKELFTKVQRIASDVDSDYCDT